MTPVWTTYDRFDQARLDPARWAPLDYAGPRVEPSARTTVNDGAVTVELAGFSTSSDTDQGLDNSKHVMVTTEEFRIPEGGVGRFGAQLRSRVRDASGDYRFGFASFTVVDTTGRTNNVFAVFSTGDRVYAEQELLPGHPTSPPFTRVIEDPFFFSRACRRPDDGWLECVIELDRRRQQVTYTVDGRLLHEAGGLPDLPDAVHMTMGIFTLVPIDADVRPALPLGGSASWRDVRFAVDT